jgi:tetratricopeptide (TPR) repeat protein
MKALLLFNAGAKAYNDGDLDIALGKFGEAIDEDPEFTEAHSEVAGIHHAREDHEQASLAADRVLALEPENVAALRIRYLAARELGRDGASETLDRLAELDRTPQTAVLLYNEGVAAFVAGDRERAVARYESASEIDPDLPAVHGALAAVYLDMKNYDAALASSERLLELDAENARGLSIRYNTFIAIGRNEEAQEMLETLQRVAPDAVARAYYDRGIALFDDGLIDPAIPALEQALRADPQLALGHYTLALCYMNRNRDEDARRHLQTFVELAPDDPDAGSARQLLEILARSD